jgi:hypothetical protein
MVLDSKAVPPQHSSKSTASCELHAQTSMTFQVNHALPPACAGQPPSRDSQSLAA